MVATDTTFFSGDQDNVGQKEVTDLKVVKWIFILSCISYPTKGMSTYLYTTYGSLQEKKANN